MNHVMIDLETFGTRSHSVIVSIGAVQFDPYRVGAIGATFHQGIDVESSLTRGLRMDPSTILWWLKQEQSAREALGIKLHRAWNLPFVLGQFTDFVEAISPDAKVWGNGADFDLVLLQQAYEACGMDKPWKYNASRCYRTMRSEFGTEADWVKPTVAHDALADAMAQAETLQNIFARMRGGVAVAR